MPMTATAPSIGPGQPQRRLPRATGGGGQGQRRRGEVVHATEVATGDPQQLAAVARREVVGVDGHGDVDRFVEVVEDLPGSRVGGEEIDRPPAQILQRIERGRTRHGPTLAYPDRAC